MKLIQPRFASKPDVKALTIEVRDPIERKWVIHRGVLEVNLYRGSIGRVSLEIPKGQSFEKIWLNGKLFSSEKAKIDGNRLTVGFKTPTRREWDL